MSQPDVDALAQIVWDYLHLGHTLRRADCIVVLGSHDTRVAERGARLFLDGLAPWIVFSGGLGNLTAGVWTRPEADLFAEIAREMGVPPERTLIENRSTNTGENVRFTDRLLTERSIPAQTLILVQKPYMERRTYATAKVHWPDKTLLVASPPIDMAAYPTPEITREAVIHIMVGDLQRIRLYPDKGFQIPQEIPPPVWDAYEKLVALGYDEHLIPPER